MSSSEEQEGNVTRDLARRNMLSALGVLGLGGMLSACEGRDARGAESDPAAAPFAESALSAAGLEYFRTMADLRATMPATIPDAVFLLGYYVPGDGGGGLFHWEASSTAVDDGGLIIEPSWNTGSPGRWRRQADHSVSVRWFGAFASPTVPGGVAYTGPTVGNVAAFTAAIRSLTPDVSAGYFGPRVVVPPGLYDMEGTLQIDRSVTLIGAGGYHGVASSWLRFPPNTTGLWVYRNLPAPVPPPTPPLHQRPRGDFSVIEGLKITGSGTTGHGILVHALCSLRHCFVQSFGGNGVHIEAAVPATGANLWRIYDVHVGACEHGLFVDGPDTNAGTCIGLNASTNRGWGVFDSSFLGNTYVGCHASGNGSGPYKSDSLNSRSVFLGCYSEGDDPPKRSEIDGPPLVLGGFMDNGGTSGQLGQLTTGEKWVTPAIRAINNKPYSPSDTSPMTVHGQLGSGNVGRTALEFVSGDDPRPYRLIYDNSTNGSRTGWWELNWAMAAGGTPIAFCHAQAPEYAEKTPTTVKTWMPRGYYVGTPRAGRTAAWDGRVFTTSGSAPPSSGTWSKGDRVLNNDPSPGHPTRGCAGWICIFGSDASWPQGQWVPFGSI